MDCKYLLRVIFLFCLVSKKTGLELIECNLSGFCFLFLLFCFLLKQIFAYQGCKDILTCYHVETLFTFFIWALC